MQDSILAKYTIETGEKDRNERLVGGTEQFKTTFLGTLPRSALTLTRRRGGDGMGMRGERVQAGLRGARPKPNSLPVRRQHNCKQLATQSVPEEAASRIVSTFFDTVNNLITPASSHSSIPLFSFRSLKATWLQGIDLENAHRTIHSLFFYSDKQSRQSRLLFIARAS